MYLVYTVYFFFGGECFFFVAIHNIKVQQQDTQFSPFSRFLRRAPKYLKTPRWVKGAVFCYISQQFAYSRILRTLRVDTLIKKMAKCFQIETKEISREADLDMLSKKELVLQNFNGKVLQHFSEFAIHLNRFCTVVFLLFLLIKAIKEGKVGEIDKPDK